MDISLSAAITVWSAAEHTLEDLHKKSGRRYAKSQKSWQKVAWRSYRQASQLRSRLKEQRRLGGYYGITKKIRPDLPTRERRCWEIRYRSYCGTVRSKRLTLGRRKFPKLAEKILTLAINTYTDTVKKIETRKNNKGQDIKVELVNDGAKKLAARRKIMAKVYDLQEQRKDNETKANFIARTENIRHPLIEKIFNEYAPKYAQRGKEKGQMGGYTRVLKLGARRGDSAEAAVIELI